MRKYLSRKTLSLFGLAVALAAMPLAISNTVSAATPTPTNSQTNKITCAKVQPINSVGLSGLVEVSRKTTGTLMFTYNLTVKPKQIVTAVAYAQEVNANGTAVDESDSVIPLFPAKYRQGFHEWSTRDLSANPQPSVSM